MTTPVDAQRLIQALRLERHPEGGWYRETWRSRAPDEGRPNGSAIYFLLASTQQSHLHRLDADEVWHHYFGAPVELRVGLPETGQIVRILGSDLSHNQEPQIVVPANEWQQARSLGEYSLVGCTVSPAFGFEGFELAE